MDNSAALSEVLARVAALELALTENRKRTQELERVVNELRAVVRIMRATEAGPRMPKRSVGRD